MPPSPPEARTPPSAFPRAPPAALPAPLTSSGAGGGHGCSGRGAGRERGAAQAPRHRRRPPAACGARRGRGWAGPDVSALPRGAAMAGECRRHGPGPVWGLLASAPGRLQGTGGERGGAQGWWGERGRGLVLPAIRE